MSGSNFVFNIAKGRVTEYYKRIMDNDPLNSVYTVVVLTSQTTIVDATLIDIDNLAAILQSGTGPYQEANQSGYSRREIHGGSSPALPSFPNPDDGNDRYDLDFPDITWTSVAATGSPWAKFLVCYDSDSSGGTDSGIIPLTAHSFDVTPDGSDITAQIAAAGFFRAA